MQAQNLAIVKGLVSVAWADGRVDRTETELIDALLEAFQAMPSEAHELRGYAATPRGLSDVPLEDLGYGARRQLLHHSVLVTFADGEQSEKERQLLLKLAEALEISPHEARAIFRTAEEHARSLLPLL